MMYLNIRTGRMPHAHQPEDFTHPPPYPCPQKGGGFTIFCVKNAAKRRFLHKKIYSLSSRQGKGGMGYLSLAPHLKKK